MTGSTAGRAHDGYGRRVAGGAVSAPKLLPTVALPSPPPFNLVPRPRGALGSLAPAAVDVTTPPGPGTALLAVKAVGLNFRDVLNVLGLYPGDAGDPGSDFSGVVLASDAATAVARPGDTVFGLATGCLGSHVCASALTLAPLPPNTTFEAAATMPTVFVTADAALAQVAGIKRGERLLLPAAAGGVGLACVQLAQAAGAAPLATAGSPAKRHLLRSLGVEAVCSSRGLAAAEELALLGGADVVVNSLTSPGMVGAALALLRRGGRLVEIGKRDVWSGAAVAAQRPDVSYSLLAVDFMGEEGLQAALQRLSAALAAGRVSPLPGSVHALSAAPAGLRQLSQARHVGKVVVSPAAAAAAATTKAPGLVAPHTPAALAAAPAGSATLVVGGTGTLGSLMVGWLAERGAAAIPAASRSGRLTASLGRLLAGDNNGSAAHCAAVTAVACDSACAADAAAVASCLGGRSLVGVLHAGGVLADATLPNQSVARVRKVFGPKASALDALSLGILRTHPLAATVLFSSVTALLGAPGQANYAAANAALDAAAAALQAEGSPAVSVQWGAWAGAGMAAGDPGTAARVERSGLGLVTPAAGLAALEGALHLGGSAAPVLAASPFNWGRLLGRFGTAEAAPRLFSEFAAVSPVPAAPQHRLTAPGVTPASVLATVREAVAGVLGPSVAPDAPLMAAGLDSLGAVELRGALEARFQGVPLPPTLVFDYPTPAALAAFISSQIGAADGDATTPAGASSSLSSSPLTALPGPSPAVPGAATAPASPRPLVVIAAAACRSPGGAVPRLEATDAIHPVPLSRWDLNLLPPSSAAAAAAPLAGGPDSAAGDGTASDRPARFGGWLRGIEGFDAAAFGISATEAELIDPQQRLLLEATAEALRAAATGWDANQFAAASSDACVAVGIASAEYNGWVLRRAGQPPSAYGATGGALSVAAGRISFTFGLRGAAVSIDTACSSSLVAAHWAAGQIAAGVSRAGVAGGVGLILSPDATAMFAKAGMLAADGRCKTLDAAADGYVRAEAVGVLLLQTLETGSSTTISATPLAILAGSAVNQDGRSSGLTAPNGPAQQAVVRAALAAAGLGAEAVGSVELHGTGTGLGDPIEVGALAAVFSSSGTTTTTTTASASVNPPVLLTAGKSWVGHSEAAAGAIGLLQAAAGLRAMCAQPLLHLVAPNPYLGDWRPPAGSGVGGGWALPRQAGGMPCSGSGSARGVSSFAFQGTNAHALLLAPPADGVIPAAAAAVALPWRRTRTWAAPAARPFVVAALPAPHAPGGAAGRVTLACHIGGPACAFLWDNFVAGSPWLSTSAVLEIASEAASLLAPPCRHPAAASDGGAGAAAAGAAAATLLLTGVVLPTGLVLPSPDDGGSRSSASRPAEVSVVAHTATGLLEVQATEAASGATIAPGRHRPHHALLFATLAQAASPAVLASCAPAALAGRAARLLFPPTTPAAPTTEAAAAFAAVDAAAVPDLAGLIFHPCCLEAALQLEGAALAEADAARPPAPLDPAGSGTAAAPALIKVPASMAGFCVPSTGEGGISNQQGAASRSLSALATPPHHAAGPSGLRALTGAALMPADGGAANGSGSGGVACRVVEAEFRPLALGAAPAAATGTAAFDRWTAAGGEAAAATGPAAAPAPAGSAAASAPPPAAPWSTDLEPWEVQRVVAAAVASILGSPVPPDEPLMAAGLDSLGAVELRGALRERLGGPQLPPTLLYDYQTIEDIADYITNELSAPRQTANGSDGAGAAASSSGAAARPGSGRGAAAARGAPAPSGLLKLLRGAPPQRPLFLAAPGVANAQSAYFAFAQFLSWSDQPIYVLEKDNDLSIAQLARRNAEDILRVQPEGPFLVGGHSYGGAVAAEVALVLEGWGHEVGLVLIMDTPRPEQIRPMQPDAPEATEADCLELMEMILGALGRDAIGLGASMAHPRDSEEWRSMTMRQRYEFFAPIWRVMRDDNVTVDDVAAQVAYVALAVKQGSQVSDMRRHRFSGRLKGAQVVYFRANNAGACGYFRDERNWRFAHGTTWAELADDVTVVDVPGDHFSLLRQDAPDMEPLVAMLKLKLGAFGWAEALRRERKAPRSGAAAAAAAALAAGGDDPAAELGDYLEAMGVSDVAIRQRLASALPVADLGLLSAAHPGGAPTAPTRPAQLLRPLNRPSTPRGARPPVPLIIVPDADASMPDLAPTFEGLPRRAYALDLPPPRHLARLRTVSALAALLARAVRDGAPPGPVMIAGVGAGGVVAHELAAQLQAAGIQVPVLLLIEDSALRAASDICQQPYFRLSALLSAWRPGVDLAAFAAQARLLGAAPGGRGRQLDAVYAMAPEGVGRADWRELVEDRLRRTTRSGPQWEETLASWVALHAFATRAQLQYEALAAAAAAAPPLPCPSPTGSGGSTAGDDSGARDSLPNRLARRRSRVSRSGSGASPRSAASGGSGPPAAEPLAPRRPPPLPPLDAFLLDLFESDGDADGQLDYMARFKPPAMPPGDWDRGVSQILSRVAYLAAITRTHAPDALLPWTSHVLIHGAGHRGIGDLASDGGAGGALQPVVPFLLPMQLRRWSDTRPAARDLEAALRDGESDAARVAAAVRTLAMPPVVPRGVEELRGMGLGSNPDATFVLPPPLPAGATASGATPHWVHHADQQQQAAAAAQLSGPSRANPLNPACFSPEARPGATALAAARARLALPRGSDVSAEEDAAQRDALRRAAAEQRRLATRLPLWLVHGEGGVCGAAARAVAADLPLPVMGLELTEKASQAPGGGGPAEVPASLQDLAASHAETLLSIQPHGPHVLCGLGPFSCALAAAIACHLERSGAPGPVGLILVDGAPAPPPQLAPTAPAPQAYALYGLLADAAAYAGAPGSGPGPWLAVAAEFAAALAVQEAASNEALGATAPPAAERALRSIAERRRPATASAGPSAARAWAASVDRTAASSHLAARLMRGSPSPEFLIQGPTVLVTADSNPDGAALLAMSRECCCGPLSLLAPGGNVRSGEGLATPSGRAALVEALSDALTELLALV